MSIKIQGNVNFQGKTILGTAIPTYAIERSLSAVNEGSSVVFTLSTTNVANGTVLPYTISGISSTDVTTGSLTGSFTVNGGSATTTITMSADQLTEGAETVTLTLNNAAASSFVVVNDTSTFDSDALAYVNAVQAADGASLENSVRLAINDFVVGCKADGIWSAIKASCILAGARTLNGALVPLVGTAPTNFNFVSADYNRKTGLIGNGSTKYLNSNRNNNADPQNNQHIGVYASEVNTTANGSYIGGGNISNGGSSIARAANASNDVLRSRGTGGFGAIGAGSSAGFKFISRSLSTTFHHRVSNVIGSAAQTSATPFNELIRVFSRGSGSVFGNPRLSFYSIGTNLDLAKLDTRVSAFMTAINAAI